jgi:uncharacterized protein (DUF2235 family)
MKRIVLCFDGTWNTPDDDTDDGDESTNVHLLHQAVAAADAAGVKQDKWYDEGVGTRWYTKIPGGAFGVGLSENIREGYEALVDRYEDGDEIFVFGFSRGAYTARSLVGMIRNAGLLRRQHRKLVGKAYALYRTRNDTADSENSRFFRQSYAREVKVKCVGVWDTVGALGVPLKSFQWFNRHYYEFHDTELSGIVENGFHALAIDEHRENYQATLWAPRQKPAQRIEQAWFVGAHSNVGGGYKERALSDVTLKWMVERVGKHTGLAFDAAKLPGAATSVGAPIVDSYAKFLRGVYKTVSERYLRPIGVTTFGAERVDPSVVERWRNDPHYRPKNDVGDHAENTPAGAHRLHGWT